MTLPGDMNSCFALMLDPAVAASLPLGNTLPSLWDVVASSGVVTSWITRGPAGARSGAAAAARDDDDDVAAAAAGSAATATATVGGVDSNMAEAVTLSRPSPT